MHRKDSLGNNISAIPDSNLYLAKPEHRQEHKQGNYPQSGCGISSLPEH